QLHVPPADPRPPNVHHHLSRPRHRRVHLLDPRRPRPRDHQCPHTPRFSLAGPASAPVTPDRTDECNPPRARPVLSVYNHINVTDSGYEVDWGVYGTPNQPRNPNPPR